MKSEYLIFNALVALGPVVALLFVPKIRKPAVIPTLIALAFPALGFVLWDIAVTGIFWTFNSAFTLGPRIGGVPLEEVLFFFTVPFGCLVLWTNWSRLHDSQREQALVPIVLILIFIPLAFWSVAQGWYYTGSISAIFVSVVIIDYICKVKLFWRGTFHSFSLIVILLTFVFNLYLTARPVVLYNAAMKSNLNILTIPAEDFVYGLVLISCVILLYELIERLKINR